MILGRVIGSVVATEKHADYAGRKLLLVQPIGPEGEDRGAPIIAVEDCQAGPGDRVLVVDEGGSARIAVGAPDSVTIRTAVVGIVDRVDIEDIGG
jgi:ethanolamine utilization protein EutN